MTATSTEAVLMAPLVNEREHLALRLTADGLEGRGLARAMEVSRATARVILGRACRAVGRDHPAQAVLVAVVHRLVTAGDLSGAVPEAGTLCGEDVAVLEQVVSGLTASEIAAAHGWSTGHATAVIHLLKGRFRARTLAHLGALALAHDLVPCHLVDDRLPRVPLSALPAPRTPATLADAMSHAQQFPDQGGADTGEQLPRDLRIVSNATTHSAVQDASGVGQRAVGLAQIVFRWLPVAQEFRSAAVGSPAHLRRWDHAISHVSSAGSLTRPLGETAAYAVDVRRLLEAVRDGRSAGSATPAGFANSLALLVESHEYYPGCPMSAYQLARDHRLPRSLVDDAIQDLLANGVLEGSVTRPLPAGSRATQKGHAGVVAARLRDQLAAGLYPPGTTLSLSDLATFLCATVRETNSALRQLVDEGLVVPGSGQVTEAAARLTPTPRLDPPHPYAQRPAGARITMTAGLAHMRWDLRRPISPTDLSRSWDTLRRMAAQLLPSGNPENLAVRRVMEAVTAPWPGMPRDRVWHLACLGRALAALQQHLTETEAGR
ncbi:GntR family transcriptional regulator [Streptomyces albipurpureus]|uniref:GntR family transcriptional regulator n=1 Tax=Streptomyces albipurpureus TaxID=2897419 RepID=A0ABT0UL98_9ACTN|nr:GntR family transcriptional regulator [Streptomyces sp. CWNU-1]MCM2388794.1 GntR family transcriptional regulator [Streptomyces sp. CWNU-1]